MVSDCGVGIKNKIEGNSQKKSQYKQYLRYLRMDVRVFLEFLGTSKKLFKKMLKFTKMKYYGYKHRCMLNKKKPTVRGHPSSTYPFFPNFEKVSYTSYAYFLK